MENSRLKSRILMEIEKQIEQSSAKGKMTRRFQNFHSAIIKKYYNATDVKIDYHRHRVKMNLMVDDALYDPKTVNINLPVLPTNMFFKNLSDFLKSCLERDDRSIAFYAKLIKDLTSFNKVELVY
ncbi:MAG: hypothetical protein HKP38_12795 [Croceitalea sp.]|nr:hypothetical protein [Croceitalea sp.]NNL10092.1 hypothetical protein [Croceitalea sp.]NNM18852.1 hypothetical protein [Croceitalea sp.]